MLIAQLDITEMEKDVLNAQKDALNVPQLPSVLNATLNLSYTELNAEIHVLSTSE